MQIHELSPIQPYCAASELAQKWDRPDIKHEFILLNNQYMPSEHHKTIADIKAYEITDKDYKRQEVTGRCFHNENGGVFYIDSDNACFGEEVDIRARYLVCSQENRLLFYEDLRVYENKLAMVNGEFISISAPLPFDAYSKGGQFNLLSPVNGWLMFAQA